jgi:hypothetical protein
MLKKISAALLVASMFTAPALAATAVKTDAPAVKTEKAPITKSENTPAASATKSDAMKPAVSNAKAQATDTKAVKKVTPHRRHRMHVSHRLIKKHVASKTSKSVSLKKVSAVKPSAKLIKNKV